MRRLLVALWLLALPAWAADSPTEGFARVLAARVGPTGEVAFRTLRRDDGKTLTRYVESLAAVDPATLDPDGQVAFWLNAYHALMLSAVAHGEDPSDVRGRARMFHWFGATIGGKRRTLDETRAILDRYATVDARIHLAVSDGTRSGPSLPAAPYVPERLDSALAAAARRFANDPRNVRLGHGQLVEVSRVFDWYRADFERTSGSVAAFLRNLVTDPALVGALSLPSPAIVYVPYDWDLAAAGD